MMVSHPTTSAITWLPSGLGETVSLPPGPLLPPLPLTAHRLYILPPLPTLLVRTWQYYWLASFPGWNGMEHSSVFCFTTSVVYQNRRLCM